MDNFQYLIKEQQLCDLAETLAQRGKGKYAITEVAISKIPYVVYPDLSNNDNLIIHELAEKVLQYAKDKNDSSEVAITYDLDNRLDISEGVKPIMDKAGVCYGTCDEMDLFSDPQTMRIVLGARSIAVINIHNHPSCSSFSTVDISSFLRETAIKLMIVIGNNGELYYLSKNPTTFNYYKARKYLNDIGNVVHPGINENSILTAKEQREVADLFLKNAVNFGMEYKHVLSSSKKLQEEGKSIFYNATRGI